MRLIYQRDARGFLQGQFVTTPGLSGEDAPPTLDLDASRALLARNHVGRLAFVRYDQPVMLPVNYALDADGHVVFRTARGSKLWVAENERVPAAFEVDEFDADTGRGSAVVVRGPMAAVTELVDVQRLNLLDVRPFADTVDRDRWVRITIESVEGWELVGPTTEATTG